MVRRLRGRIEMEDGTAAGTLDSSSERNVKKSTDSRSRRTSKKPVV